MLLQNPSSLYDAFFELGERLLRHLNHSSPLLRLFRSRSLPLSDDPTPYLDPMRVSNTALVSR